VKIVQADCETLLGNFVNLTFESEGYIEALTTTPITRGYIQTTLTQGKYLAQVRTAAHCISKNGLCLVCYRASRPADSTTIVGHTVKFDPEFIIKSEVVTFPSGGQTANLSMSTEEYDHAYVYFDGTLMAVSISGSTLTLPSPTSATADYTVKYAVISRVPFFYWLAGTFSGSLLGIKSLPIEALSLKPSLFSSLIPESEIEYLVGKISSWDLVPSEIKEYLPNIQSLMEKALLAIAVDSLFSNVTS